MPETNSECKIRVKSYELEPPNGGWGYIVTCALAIMFMVTGAQFLSFGIIYRGFMKKLGDEASNTTISSGTFNTIIFFMGLVANSLLKKYSRRFVGIIGSIFFFFGNFLTAFATTLWQFIITYSILQGIGFGLMVVATFTAFNDYFTTKRTFLISFAHAVVAFGSMLTPFFIETIKDEFGYRGAVIIMSAISLNTFLAMLTLQPVKWHLIKVPLSLLEMTGVPENNKVLSSIEEKKEKKSNKIKCFKSILQFFEISLLKDLIYVNIAVGMSVVFVTDLLFVSLLPMFLGHMGYNLKEVASLMTVFMFADLVGRLLQSCITAYVNIKSRFLFLTGALLITLLRIIFLCSPNIWMWTIILCSGLGCTRCLTQVNVPLVIAEYCQISKINFPAAFGLFHTICGCFSFISGQLSSIVAKNTVGDNGIQILFIVQLLLCIIPWLIEIIYKMLKN